MPRIRSRKSRIPIGISSRPGATSRSKKRRSRKPSSSSRATSVWRSAAPERRLTRSSRKRKCRTSRPASFRRCKRSRSCRTSSRASSRRMRTIRFGMRISCRRRRCEQLPTSSELSAVIAAARRNRPEVRQAEDRRLAADIDVAFAKNQSLPQADVQAQYQSNGFAGILTPVPAFILGYCTESRLTAALV